VEVILMVVLLDTAQVGDFVPFRQIYQYVTPEQCEILRDRYLDNPYRLTICLDDADIAREDSIETLVALAEFEREKLNSLATD